MVDIDLISMLNVFNFISTGNYLQVTYDLICPDFDSEAMQKILELLYNGSSRISRDDRDLIREIESICRALHISALDKLFGGEDSEQSQTGFQFDQVIRL